MIYPVQLFMKDDKERSKPEVYRVLLLTTDDKGKEFFDNEKPVNLYRSERLFKKLTMMYEEITRFHCYLNCVVTKMGTKSNFLLQILDTVVNLKKSHCNVIITIVYL